MFSNLYNKTLRVRAHTYVQFVLRNWHFKSWECVLHYVLLVGNCNDSWKIFPEIQDWTPLSPDQSSHTHTHRHTHTHTLLSTVCTCWLTSSLVEDTTVVLSWGIMSSRTHTLTHILTQTYLTDHSVYMLVDIFTGWGHNGSVIVGHHKFSDSYGLQHHGGRGGREEDEVSIHLLWGCVVEKNTQLLWSVHSFHYLFE